MTTPLVLIRPIEFPKKLVNHRAPSGPTVIPSGPLIGVGKEETAAEEVQARPNHMPRRGVLPARRGMLRSGPLHPTRLALLL